MICSLFKFLFYIGAQLINNIVSVRVYSRVIQLYVNVSILFRILFPFRILQGAEFPVLYSRFLSFICFKFSNVYVWGLPQWVSSKESVCIAGDTGDIGLIPGWGRLLGGGNGNPLQYSCVENPLDRGAWWATVHGVTKSWTRLSTCIC